MGIYLTASGIISGAYIEAANLAEIILGVLQVLVRDGLAILLRKARQAWVT